MIIDLFLHFLDGHWLFLFFYKITILKMKITTFLSVLSLLLWSSCSKPAEQPVATLPVVAVTNLSQFNSEADVTFPMKVSLDKTTTSVVTVNYATMDIDAVAGTDYVAQTGTLSFPANTTEQIVNIKVLGNKYKQDDKTFALKLSNPANATLSSSAQGIGTIRSTSTLLPGVTSDSTGFMSLSSYPGYKLVWQDEFSGTKIDTSVWGYDIGGNGWGNHELEFYTNSPKNSYLSNGSLVIEARNDNGYTSARMLTKGRKDFTYGRVDIRAKIPTASGMWPALWMLGSNIDTKPWPACGETDIMEVVGRDSKKLYSTLHFADASGNHQQNGGTVYNIEDLANKYHVYSMNWTTSNIEFYLDGNLYFSANITGVNNQAFNNPSFFIFNVAVGGDFPGSNITPNFPQRMYVDYVRVFQKS